MSRELKQKETDSLSVSFESGNFTERRQSEKSMLSVGSWRHASGVYKDASKPAQVDKCKKLEIIEQRVQTRPIQDIFSISSPPPPPPTPVKTPNAIVASSRLTDHIHLAVPPETSQKPKEEQEKKVKQTSFKVRQTIPNVFDETDLTIQTSGCLQDVKEEAECSRYAGVEGFANQFIDGIIGKSVDHVNGNKNLSLPNKQFSDEEKATLSSMHTYVEIFGTFTRWPRIEEFTKELGESAINEYMLTWDYEEDWLYFIRFILEQSDECSDYYTYEVIWSIPTRPYPIPQATANVYFTIEVSRVKPVYCPVDVSYVFEGSRLIHVPGKIPFREQWLFNVIDAKIELFKRLKM